MVICSVACLCSGLESGCIAVAPVFSIHDPLPREQAERPLSKNHHANFEITHSSQQHGFVYPRLCFVVIISKGGLRSALFSMARRSACLAMEADRHAMVTESTFSFMF